MNTTSSIDAISGVEASNQAPTITAGVIETGQSPTGAFTSAIIEAEQSATEAITTAITEAEQRTTEAISSWVQSSARLAPVILQGFAGVLVVLYLLGVCALAGGLLFYTFSR